MAGCFDKSELVCASQGFGTEVGITVVTPLAGEAAIVFQEVSKTALYITVPPPKASTASVGTVTYLMANVTNCIRLL